MPGCCIITEQQEACCKPGCYGSLLCRDLQQLLLEWLLHDPDLIFILSRGYTACAVHNDNENACAIAHVSRRTEELQWAALERVPFNLRYKVRDFFVLDTERLKQKAVSLEWQCILDIENPSEAVQLIALQQNGRYLKSIANPTYQICLTAVQNTGTALYYIENQTEELCLAAVKKTGCALGAVKEQTAEICLAAVQQSVTAIQYCRIFNEDICLAAVNCLGSNLEHIPIEYQTDAVKAVALRNDPKARRYIKHRTYNLRGRLVG
jgi:hypothetical protein